MSQSQEVGELLPKALDRGGDRLTVSQQTVSFVGEVAPQAPELALVPQFLGRYEIVEFLGAGAFSRVYLAKDSQLGRSVALKVPKTERFDSPEDLATFLREARTIAGLDHPGIVSVYDVATDPSGVQFIVMQYIQGMTLQDRIGSSPTTYWEAADIVCHVAEAIHAAHKRQVFHRDLKPANILLDSEGRPHVADFGLAVLEHQQQQHVGEVAGTLVYMAPEQIRGEAQWLDGRSDIWSLGAIFYSLLTGRHPFIGKGKKISDEILHREPRPPRQIDERIPKELERICLKCLTKPVRERYFSAFDLAEDLKNWMQTEGLALAPSSNSAKFLDSSIATADSVQRPPTTTQTRRFALGFAGAAVLVLAAIGGNHYSKLNTSSNNSIAATVGGIPIKSRENPAAELAVTPTPFELDSYAVPGRWHSLLEQKPQFFAAVRRSTTKWTHDNQLQELLIDVPAPFYLDLGETKSTRFTLEATFASRDWHGDIGLFWGRKEAPSSHASEGNPIQFHVVHLSLDEFKGQRNAYLKRDRMKYLLNAAKDTGSFNGTAISAEVIPWPDNTPSRLELQVNGDVLRVYWRGQLQEGMISEAKFPGVPKLSASGRFGVFANRGTFQVSDVRIRIER